MPVAAFLAWLVPGLGYIYIGERGRGLVCLVTITATFWSGVAIGGVRSTIDPQHRKLWFMAQIATGGNTVAGYALHRALAPNAPPGNPIAETPNWSAVDVGTHYTGVAGLLNLLVIFDVIGRADSPSAGRRGAKRSAKEDQQTAAEPGGFG